MKKQILAVSLLITLTSCTTTQHSKAVDRVHFAENANECGSGGCTLTITDDSNRTLFYDLSQSQPEFLPFSTDGHRDFYVLKKHYLEQGSSESIKAFYRYNQELQQYQEINLSYYR